MFSHKISRPMSIYYCLRISVFVGVNGLITSLYNDFFVLKARKSLETSVFHS